MFRRSHFEVLASATARFLSDEMKLKIPAETCQELYKLSANALEEDPEAEGLAELLPTGAAFHYAGLVKSLRRRIESAYRDGWLRVLTATPTLAAGVNLPADVVVVRDVFRADVVRGIYRQVPLLEVPSGEILDMLGEERADPTSRTQASAWPSSRSATRRIPK